MICCVTGHRSIKFPFLHEETNDVYLKYVEKLNEEIKKLLEEACKKEIDIW